MHLQPANLGLTTTMFDHFRDFDLACFFCEHRDAGSVRESCQPNQLHLKVSVGGQATH